MIKTKDEGFEFFAVKEDTQNFTSSQFTIFFVIFAVKFLLLDFDFV